MEKIMYRFSRSSNQSSFRSTMPLSNGEIQHYAPSILATEAHESRGDRYAFIPTINVLDGLRRNGFQPFEVRQTRVRDQSKREHTKHLIRLRHESAITAGVGEEVPEIVLLNSHDGTSSYQLLSGVFRMVCSNGMIAGNVCDDIRIRHSGNVIDDVIEGSFRVLDNIQQVTDRIGHYKSIELMPAEQMAFAQAAQDLRWDRDDAGRTTAPIRDASQIIRPRRWADNGNDLWTVFNRAQENLIKGGLSGRSASGRRTSTREVGGVNENVRLNRALWTLADGLARIKSGESELLAA
jgi:hypothetical protein